MSDFSVFIYQIGRLDREFNTARKFQIDEKIYEQPLSSFAFREYLINEKKYKPKICLVFPVSLPFNPDLKNLKDESLTELKQAIVNLLENKENRDSYLKDPYNFFNLHPHTKNCNEYLVLHSIGSFAALNFVTSFDDIVLAIVFHMIKTYIKEPFKKLFLDISSGQNIYNSALIEAGRQFLTFVKLQNWINDYLKTYIVFSDPVISGSVGPYQIHSSYELNVKAFFLPPLKIKGRDDAEFNRFIKEFTKNNKELKNYLRKILYSAYFFNTALINNLPMVVYSFQHHGVYEINEAVKKVIDFGKEQLYQNFEKSPPLNKDDFIKILFMLSLYIGIVKILERYEISHKKEISLSKLNKAFRDEKGSLYKLIQLPLNREYLAHEISNTFEKEEINKKFTEEWKSLKELFLVEAVDNDIKHRNFLAHCGFERNCIEVKKQENEIYLRYKENQLKEIEKIVFSL